MSRLLDLRLRWHVFRCRRQSDTSSRFLLQLARWFASTPRAPDGPPLLEIGTRSGGSALLLPRVIPGGFLIVDATDWFGGETRRRLEAAAPQFDVQVSHHGKQTLVEVSAILRPSSRVRSS